jgi:proteasome accessory factor C
MLPWVMAHEGATVADLRERFGYDRDADVMKDLELVFLCGLPGYGPGELIDAYVLGDEVVVEDADYFSRPLRLNAAEALVLLAAGSAVMASSAAPPALASAVRKLEQVVAPRDGTIAVDLGEEPPNVDLMRRAAADGSVVRIEYTSVGSGRTTTRDIEPWAVFSSLGNWYVRAHCRLAEGERLFRLDRIRAAERTEEAFTPVTDTAVPEELYSPSADDVHARIMLAPGASWVTEYYPVEIIDSTAEGILIDFATTSPEVAARLLIRLGGEARLIDGDAVAEMVAELRERVLARYE